MWAVILLQYAYVLYTAYFKMIFITFSLRITPKSLHTALLYVVYLMFIKHYNISVEELELYVCLSVWLAS